MSTRRTTSKVLAGSLVLAMLTLTMAPAFADDSVVPPVGPTIVAGVTVRGIDLGGLTVAQAAATITANVPEPTGTITVRAAGSSFVLKVADAALMDATATALAASEATGPADVQARYSPLVAVVNAFVKGISSRVAVTPVSAKRKIVKRRLKLTAPKDGRSVDPNASSSVVLQAISTRLAAGGSGDSSVVIPLKTLKPKTTAKNIGKTVLVVLRERRVYVYNGAKVEKTYRCAIGMHAYPTPTGTFKVIGKSMHPTWYNPGSSWGAGMPSSIRPGPRNPLGLRALYLSASGIRIHGTSNTGSIGRAASHGCVRLANKDVVNIYPRVKVGVPVYIVK